MNKEPEDRFPDGKISSNDEGILNIKMGLTENDKFVISFGKPLTWFAMTKDGAVDFAKTILRSCVDQVISVKTEEMPQIKLAHELVVDAERMDLPPTGVYVRALGPDGQPGSFDIVQLDGPSVLTWLRSRGGKNQWAEMFALSLLARRRSGCTSRMSRAGSRMGRERMRILVKRCRSTAY